MQRIAGRCKNNVFPKFLAKILVQAPKQSPYCYSYYSTVLLTDSTVIPRGYYITNSLYDLNRPSPHSSGLLPLSPVAWYGIFRVLIILIATTAHHGGSRGGHATSERAGDVVPEDADDVFFRQPPPPVYHISYRKLPSTLARTHHIYTYNIIVQKKKKKIPLWAEI